MEQDDKQVKARTKELSRMKKRSDKLKCCICGKANPEFKSPADLCELCWNKWWDGEIEVKRK